MMMMILMIMIIIIVALKCRVDRGKLIHARSHKSENTGNSNDNSSNKVVVIMFINSM